jgi:primosomal protein N' (replication factor Y)
MLYAEVAVNSTFPHREPFSYSLPDGLEIQPGCGVYVPFGRLTLQGVVVEVHDTALFSPPEKIRSVRSLIGDTPLIDRARLQLARWIADYYMAPIFDAVALMLPPGFERRPLATIRPLVDVSATASLGLPAKQRAVLDAIIMDPGIEVGTLRERVDVPGLEGVLAQLERRELIVREYGLARPTVSAKSVEVAELTMSPNEASRRIDSASTPKHSRRADVLEQLLPRREISIETAVHLAGSRANLDRLVRVGEVRFDREERNVVLAMSPMEAHDAVRRLRETRRTEQAHGAVARLEKGDPIPVPTLRAGGVDSTTTGWLREIGVIKVSETAVERDPLQDMHAVRKQAPALLPAQAYASAAIGAAIGERRSEPFLLHGVTGSGKTEVYLSALDRCIESGRKSIVLVPEIALTAQTVRRFRERFDRVAVLHSGLGAGEMFDQWHGIAGGRYDVVIGSRSAIFAPQPDLGLIVIDEEHEWTYKQHDGTPRYHARDVALELGRLKDAAVVLGSATPDVCSYERAAREVYTLLPLPDRVQPSAMSDEPAKPTIVQSMPSISVVDLRAELRAGNRSMFSVELKAAVESALSNDEQVILFLNRRGLASHVQCRDCGFVPACSSCAIALTYHRQYDRLVCHQCSRRTRLPSACRECGSPRVRLVGAGVEKLEAEAARSFPHARILRWDRDSTRGRHAHERILAAFLAHEADILIGTQMLAKGLDLPSVTLVGVVNADVGLHIPDVRAGERTFQILTQVAGRAGRGERPGRVIIQTYTPDHYAIEAAARYDYEGFVAAELEARERLGYPPFSRLVRLTFAHTNPRFARDEAMRMQRTLSQRRAELGSDAVIVGPSPAYVPRVRGRYRWQIVIRGRQPDALLRESPMAANWSVDIDPVTLA